MKKDKNENLKFNPYKIYKKNNRPKLQQKVTLS